MNIGIVPKKDYTSSSISSNEFGREFKRHGDDFGPSTPKSSTGCVGMGLGVINGMLNLFGMESAHDNRNHPTDCAPPAPTASSFSEVLDDDWSKLGFQDK